MAADVSIGEYEVAEVANGSMGYKVSSSGGRGQRVNNNGFV